MFALLERTPDKQDDYILAEDARRELITKLGGAKEFDGNTANLILGAIYRTSNTSEYKEHFSPGETVSADTLKIKICTVVTKSMRSDDLTKLTMDILGLVYHLHLQQKVVTLSIDHPEGNRKIPVISPFSNEVHIDFSTVISLALEHTGNFYDAFVIAFNKNSLKYKWASFEEFIRSLQKHYSKCSLPPFDDDKKSTQIGIKLVEAGSFVEKKREPKLYEIKKQDITRIFEIMQAHQVGLPEAFEVFNNGDDLNYSWKSPDEVTSFFNSDIKHNSHEFYLKNQKLFNSPANNSKDIVNNVRMPIGGIVYDAKYGVSREQFEDILAAYSYALEHFSENDPIIFAAIFNDIKEHNVIRASNWGGIGEFSKTASRVIKTLKEEGIGTFKTVYPFSKPPIGMRGKGTHKQLKVEEAQQTQKDRAADNNTRKVTAQKNEPEKLDDIERAERILIDIERFVSQVGKDGFGIDTTLKLLTNKRELLLDWTSESMVRAIEKLGKKLNHKTQTAYNNLLKPLSDDMKEEDFSLLNYPVFLTADREVDIIATAKAVVSGTSLEDHFESTTSKNAFKAPWNNSRELDYAIMRYLGNLDGCKTLANRYLAINATRGFSRGNVLEHHAQVKSPDPRRKVTLETIREIIGKVINGGGNIKLMDIVEDYKKVDLIPRDMPFNAVTAKISKYFDNKEEPAEKLADLRKAYREATRKSQARK